MNEIIKQSLCTGCGACVVACPFAAVEMRCGIDGFYYPCVLQEKCKDCGGCHKVCPAFNKQSSDNKIHKVFAAMASDEIRGESSSGGAFSVIANYVIDNGGYVSGAVWDYTKLCVKHILSNNREDIALMRKSKYVQSVLGDVFKKIKEKLDDGKFVFFVGTPCQVAGLNRFIKEKSRLLTADLLCYGVANAKILKKYVSEVIVNDSDVISNIEMRSKKAGWNPAYLLQFTTGANRLIRIKLADNYFYDALFNSLSVREVCSDCRYCNTHRQGDITLGDFWWIANRNKKLDDGKGTSLILANNKKGFSFIKLLRKNFKLLVSTPLRWVTNINLFKATPINKRRVLFFANLDKLSLKENVSQCLNDSCDIAIINMWWAISNYGALLTGYALQQVLKEMGYTSLLINNISMCPDQLRAYQGTFNQKFKDKYLDTTEVLRTEEDFEALNSKAHTFICGSDQVFAPKWMMGHIKYYLLDFVDSRHKKLAFSASYGVSENEFKHYNPMIIQKMQKSLATFDGITTREKSGVSLTKTLFGLDSDYCIDPVFLLDRDNFSKLADDAENNYKDKIVSYVLDDNEDYHAAYSMLSQKYEADVITTYGCNLSAEDWLASIRDCKFFITDSFHGICFAVIFNKPFICINNAYRGSERFDSLFDILDVKNPSIESIRDVEKENDYITYLDYSVVNLIVKKECIRAKALLKMMLEKEKSPAAEKSAAYFDLLKFNMAVNLNKKKSLTAHVKNRIRRMLHQ